MESYKATACILPNTVTNTTLTPDATILSCTYDELAGIAIRRFRTWDVIFSTASVQELDSDDTFHNRSQNFATASVQELDSEVEGFSASCKKNGKYSR